MVGNRGVGIGFHPARLAAIRTEHKVGMQTEGWLPSFVDLHSCHPLPQGYVGSMPITVDYLFEEAQELSSESRVVLAERLLESVTPDEALLESQLVTAAHRAAELESGAVRGVPGPEALTRVRASILERSQA